MPKSELDRIAKALESIADSLARLTNPPLIMGEGLPDGANVQAGGITYIPPESRREWILPDWSQVKVLLKTLEKTDAR